MHYELRVFFVLLMLVVSGSISAQRTSMAFWNVENLYDTVPSLFHDDGDFTPRGVNRWDTERYRTKLANLSRVLDELAADIVGLAEVENETVVRELVSVLATDYNYIHLTSDDTRGIDLALLYKGDKFFPDPDPYDPSKPAARLISSATGREFLYVRGELSGRHVHLIVCHMASNLNSASYRRRNMAALRTAIERILTDDPAANLVVMGDMNASPNEKLVRGTLGSVLSPWDSVYSPHAGESAVRRGSYHYRGRWYLYDWMLVSPAISRGSSFKIVDAGIYARDYMTEPTDAERSAAASPATGVSSPRRPLRTFYGGDYRSGFSDHFPVYMVIVK